MTRMHFGKIAVALCALLLLEVGPGPVQAQEIDRDHVPSEQRVDPLARRQSNIDGNNLRATIFNFGQSGRTMVDPTMIPYEWPKNTGRHYIAHTGIFVGAEVESEDGETMWIVDVPNYRSRNDGATSWNFEPIPGFTNPSSQSIARSSVSDTWPSCWPDKQDAASDPGWCGAWNGYFGKDVFNADQELFYRMGDDNYDRYLLPSAENTYYPDSTDLSRGGLGLLIDSRKLAWSQILIDDVLFHLFAIKNDGTKDIRKMGVTLWLADLVGGDPGDDKPFYDLLEDVAWMTDTDGVGDDAFTGAEVGVAAASFLETPSNAADRIDNDGDGTTAIPTGSVGETNSPPVTESLLAGECVVPAAEERLPETCYDGIDNNGNGLIDENRTHVTFGQQLGVGYGDFIDNDGDGEQGGPVVTQDMVTSAANDTWQRWPPDPAGDPVQAGSDGGPLVHLVGLGDEDIGDGFKDNIDNDESDAAPPNSMGEAGSPVVTQAMIDAAADDPYGRYRVPETDIILYAVGPEDLDKAFADGFDNDGDGAVDEGIDEGIDEMIDESRSDGLDNDEDWQAAQDDVGIDGSGGSGDAGEGDGRPSSGTGTSLPGEPNIDETDVSESDQIGITNVQYDPAGGISYNSVTDRQLFRDFMAPGSFYDPSTSLEGDYDLFVSSGTFPLQAGETKRISYAIMLGQDQEAVLRKRSYALEAYKSDYQFAQAPPTPTVRAVPGDGEVTLYWDRKAEEALDGFIADLEFGPNPRDFEGYRVYRSTDPSFLDAKVITDGFGNSQFLKPIAQFDLDDGKSGFHAVAVNGTKFYLGEDTGLQHVFVDTTALNGVQYYYAVTAYDYGAVFPSGEGGAVGTTSGSVAGIPPTETPISINFGPDGTVATGPNAVAVRPSERAAGYQDPTIGSGENRFIPHVAGATTSTIGYEIIDPAAIEDGHSYRVEFEDTLETLNRNEPPILVTKNFSLTDLTDDEVVISKSTAFEEGREVPVTEGFRLSFNADPFVVLDAARTHWNDSTNFPIALAPYSEQDFGIDGFRNPANYRLEIGPEGFGQSVELQLGSFTIPSRPTNVRVFNTTTGEQLDYVFIDRTEDDGGFFSDQPADFNADPEGGSKGVEETDYIVLIEELPNGNVEPSWRISLDFTVQGASNPDAGDEATIITEKPFLSQDVFEFTVKGATVDQEKARSELDDVLVVPNPYQAASIYEPRSAFSYGRERRIQFKNLPQECTIRIFDSSGRLVRELEHRGTGASGLMDGTESWDLLSKDGLAVSYGLYLYHVEAPGIGETTGTFAVIK